VTALFIHSNAAAQQIAGYGERSPDRVDSGDGIMPTGHVATGQAAGAPVGCADPRRIRS